MNNYDERLAQQNHDFDLSDFDDEFASLEPTDFEEVPDGKYQMRVGAVRLDRSQRGDPMIKWDLIVISGPHAGRHVFKNSVVTSASLPFVKGEMQTVGLALDKFSDLPEHLESLLDITLEITKRTRGEFTNIYFNKRIQIPVNNQHRPGDDHVPF